MVNYLVKSETKAVAGQANVAIYLVIVVREVKLVKAKFVLVERRLVLKLSFKLTTLYLLTYITYIINGPYQEHHQSIITAVKAHSANEE